MPPPLLTRDDLRCLNELLAVALSEPEVRHRLLAHDPKLIVDFHLSTALWHLISQIHASSLSDFCRQLLKLEACL